MSDDEMIIKEFVFYIKNNSEQILKMIEVMETDKPGSPSYESAIEYIKNLCEKSNEFAKFLNNLLNDN